jgi:hypothetical protein
MAFLWTGSQIPVYLFGESSKNQQSETYLTVSLFFTCRRHTTLHLQRHRGRRPMDLVRK